MSKIGTHPRWSDKSKEFPPEKITLTFYLNDEIKEGITYWKFIASEGFKDGYQSEIIDQYRPDNDRGLWVFIKRVRVWRKPYHMDSIGKSDSCPACLRFHKKNPKPPKQEVLFSGVS